jgi:YYY domain-containing protein
MIGGALLWYAVLTAGGAAAFPLLLRWGLGSGASWALARLVGWTVAGYLAWLAGCLGVERWWWIAPALLAIVLVAGAPGWRGAKLKSLFGVEALACGSFVLLALLRLPVLAVTATEKPMDLAILATLMRPGTFPPSDPWLAGASLPYYYWGFVPWVPVARLVGCAPDVAFNLLVPTLASLSAMAAWVLARALGASRRNAVLAAFLAVFAGTPDGWRQLLSGIALPSLDLWKSSRQIAGAITEFPLFTFHLGDLHPHLLAVPLMLAALALACGLRRRGSGRVVVLGMAALLYGAAAAANPWCALPIGAAVLLVVVAREERFANPLRDGAPAWLQALAVGGLGWVLFAPFWLAYRPPVSGLGVVTTPTRWDELALFMGGVLLAPLLVGWELAWRWGGLEAARRQFVRASAMTGAVVVAAATGRVGLALALALGGVLGVGIFTGGYRKARPQWGLTLVPLVLIGFVEVLYLRDPYVGEFYRMNTVFKFSHIAFTLLAVLSPVLLGWLARRRPAEALVAGALVIAVGLPQLASLALRVRPPADGWDGLGWMASGEEAAAHWLYRLPPGVSIVEGVGDAYSDAARMSAASGVPTVLGWEAHEGVWRGARVGGELKRRHELVNEFYGSADPGEVRRLAGTLGADYAVIGSVERRLYPPAGLAAVRAAGTLAFAAGDCAVVRFDE